MKTIKKNVLIASGIIEIGKSNINIKDLVNYINRVYNLLKVENYTVDKPEEHDIHLFFKYRPMLGMINNDNIVIQNMDFTIEQLNKAFLGNLSNDEIKLLKGENKYLLPVILDNEMIIYKFKTNDTIQDEVKKVSYLDDTKDSFVISLNKIEDLNIFKKFLSKCIFVKKNVISLNIVDEFMFETINLKGEKYNNLYKFFNFDKFSLEFKKTYDNLIKYYDIAIRNEEYLNKKFDNKELVYKLSK